MNHNIKYLLQQWDGKQVAYLKKLYHEYSRRAHFMDDVVNLHCSDSNFQKVSSWLIKHHYDQGNQFTQIQISKILAGAGTLKYWESQLHILQLIPRFHIDTKAAETCLSFVEVAIKSEVKFVKAAAYEAYFEIVKNIPTLQNEFKLMCERAMMTESASVKVKVKKIILKLEKHD